VSKAAPQIFVAILGVLIAYRFGFVGVFIAIPFAGALGYFLPMAKRKWARRGSIK